MAFLLAACERVGIPDPVERAAKDAAMRDEEGKAIGGACRQSGRALEDCYVLNKNAVKASVFNGWREMNDYMLANKIETVKPELPPPGMPVNEEKSADHATSSKTEDAADAQSEPLEDPETARAQRLARAKAARLAKEARRKGVDAAQSAPAAEVKEGAASSKEAAH